jgi:23S rRNA (guanosine2251-2'-O)-methyltransferase
MSREIALIVHNIRSCHNVGSLLRTAEGLAVTVYLTGYTPFPKIINDSRLPHEANKISKQINKTALGAEFSVNWQHGEIKNIIRQLHESSYLLAAVEQTSNSVELPKFKPQTKIALIVGNEVSGIESDILEMVNVCLEIPMFGKKESYNVVQAAAMALYHCRFVSIQD